MNLFYKDSRGDHALALSESYVEKVIQHMNADHKDSLRDYAAAFGGVHFVDNVVLIGLSEHSITLQCDTNGQSQILDLPLITEITRPQQVRGVLVAMAKEARKKLSGKSSD